MIKVTEQDLAKAREQVAVIHTQEMLGLFATGYLMGSLETVLDNGGKVRPYMMAMVQAVRERMAEIQAN
jgi:hypothetical protein